MRARRGATRALAALRAALLGLLGATALAAFAGAQTASAPAPILTPPSPEEPYRLNADHLEGRTVNRFEGRLMATLGLSRRGVLP